MSTEDPELTVYYDGACPRCVRDRERYRKLAGSAGERVAWVDITGREEALRRTGIDPKRALTELHVVDTGRRVHRELDACILLMSRAVWLRPLAWLIGLPGIRPVLSGCYRKAVERRLRRSGRWPEAQDRSQRTGGPEP